MVTTDTDATFQQMLAILHRGGAYGYWWNIAPNGRGKRSEWWKVNSPTPVTNGVVNAYFGVHPTTTIPPTDRNGDDAPPELVRSQIKYIAAVNGFFGEFDRKKGATIEQIERLDPRPSVIIDSGGGWHVYWFFDKPWILNTDEDRANARKAQAAWVKYVGSDGDAKDLARVLRVPGTHNLKYDPSPVVSFVVADLDLQYQRDVLLSYLPDEPHPQIAPQPRSAPLGDSRERRYAERALNDEIATVVQAKDGEKHQALRDAAVKLGTFVAAGVLLEDEVISGLEHAVIGRAVDFRNAQATIRDGLKYASSRPREIPPSNAPQPDMVEGLALCPTHHTPLVPCKNGNGWRCDDDKGCFWWAGDGYTPPAIEDVVNGLDDADVPMHTLINFDDDGVRPLPFEIDYSVGRGAGRWLDLYVDYASQVAPMSPRSFHETAALWLVSMAIARRVHVKMTFGRVYPNIFALWVARSTIWSKTTSMDIATQLAERTFRHLLSPQSATPEALFADMSGKEPPNLKDLPEDAIQLWKASRDFCAQRGFAIDEISGFLARSQREYNAGLVEAFLKFFDCGDHRDSTKGGGWVFVKNTYVSLLGASTPVMMTQHFQNPQLQANGWWYRFIIVTPDAEKPEYIENPEHVSEPPHMQSWLRGIYDRLPHATFPNSAASLELSLSADVAALWAKYNRVMRHEFQDDEIDERFTSFYGRLPTLAIKTATLLATMDWSENTPAPVIRLKHMVRAIEFCEQWRRNFHRALGATSASMAKTTRDRLLRYVAKYDDQGGLSMNDMSKLMRDIEYVHLKTAVLECVELGLIDEVKVITGKRGRPAINYRLAR